MKRLNVTLIYKVVGNTGIDVPDGLSLEEAIEYAKKHLADIPTPYDAEYMPNSDEIDEENCDFEE